MRVGCAEGKAAEIHVIEAEPVCFQQLHKFPRRVFFRPEIQLRARPRHALQDKPVAPLLKRLVNGGAGKAVHARPPFPVNGRPAVAVGFHHSFPVFVHEVVVHPAKPPVLCPEIERVRVYAEHARGHALPVIPFIAAPVPALVGVREPDMPVYAEQVIPAPHSAHRVRKPLFLRQFDVHTLAAAL